MAGDARSGEGRPALRFGVGLAVVVTILIGTQIVASRVHETAQRAQDRQVELTRITEQIRNTGVTVHGRALARNGAVTLDTDTFTKPTCASTTTTTVPAAPPASPVAGTPRFTG